MVSSRLKKRFQEIVETRITFLSKTGITPNILTLLGLAVSLLTGYLILAWRMNPFILPLCGVLVLLSGFIDAVDGILARTTGRVTVFGGFLDSLSDRYSDMIILSAVTLSGLITPIYGFAAIVGSFMVSYSRAKSEAAGVDMSGVGIAERAERMIIFALASILAFFFLEVLDWSILLLAILTNFTVLQRGAHFLRESTGHSNT
jgi:archaetidylinositol phosphate synthase